MRPALTIGLVCLVTVGVTGCSDGPPPKPVTPTATAVPAQEPRPRLAGLIAAAQDHRYTASYTFTPKGGAAKAVPVTLAVDGTWRIDIPGGALGGTANISMAGNKDGVFQCGSAPVTTGTPAPVTCVKLASPIPAKYDVRVHHLFTDWQAPLMSRNSAISVAVATLEGATGTCFSVESTSASLAAPVDPGTYCYSDDGTLTGARIAVGTILLAGPIAGPPASIALPGPVTAGTPLQLAAPPPPPPTTVRPT